MKQSKLASFIEANTNTAIGFVVSVLTWRYLIPILFPELKPYAGFSDAILITLVFTIVSIARNYVVRRIFNWRT